MDETPPNEYWSISQASRELGINKGIISQDAAKGKLQLHPRGDGTKKLFVPELFNVYADKIAKKKKQLENGDNPTSRTENKPIVNRELTVVLEAKEEVIALLKSQIDGLRVEVTDVRQDRDHWRRQAEQATEILKALPAPTNQNPPQPDPSANANVPMVAPQQPGFWARLFGRTA
jgi:hypothetical protein